MHVHFLARGMCRRAVCHGSGNGSATRDSIGQASLQNAD